MNDMVNLPLTPDEAEWLHACLGLVMQISRHWDDRTANDTANHVAAKLSLVMALGAERDPETPGER